jgi:hypothetical protein
VPSQFWEACLNSPSEGAGTQLSDSAAATDISPAPQFVVPANYMYAGQRWRMVAYGIESSASSGNPTLTLGFYYGGVAGTLLAANASLATGTSAVSWPWRMEMDMRIVTVGSSGTVWCNGKIFWPTSLAAWGITPVTLTQTMPVTINTTTANALTCGATYTSAVSGVTITCEDLLVELLN